MSISFSCENCGKSFQTDASFAGKKCKCKQCGHIFLIPSGGSSGPSRPLKTFSEPGATASPPPARPRPAPAPAARPAKPNYLDDGDDPYSIDDLAPLTPRKPAGVEEEDDYRNPKPVSTGPRKKKKPKAFDGPFAGLPAMFYMIVAGVAGVGILAGLVGLTMIGGILGGIALLGALVPLFYGGVGLLVVPFMEGVVHGILCFFFWPYQLYYLVSRWTEMRGAFLTYLSGVGVLLLSFAPFVILAARAPARPMVVVPPPAFGEMAQDAPPGIPPFAPPPGFRPPVPAPVVPAGPTVLLAVIGLDDPASREAFAQKLDELNVSHDQGNVQGDGVTMYRVWPVTDPQEFAGRIKFANVMRVVGQTLQVKADPDQQQTPERPQPRQAPPTVAQGPVAAEPGLPIPRPQPGLNRPRPAARPGQAQGDFVEGVLADLEGGDQNRRRDALRRLAGAPPDEDRKAEVAKAIEPVLKDPDGFTRSEAVKALGVWGGKENLPALLQALRDPAFNVVWAVFDALERLKEPDSAEPVASYLATPQNRGRAVQVLKAIGPPAQPAVIKYLSHGDQFVRMEAARLLKEIGTEECVPALQELIRKTNGQGLDAMAAGDALDQLGAPRFPQSPRGKKGGLVPKSKPRR